MGPLWDFDLAIGGYVIGESVADDPTGFWIKRVKWYIQLFNDPYFVSKVKEHFNYFYENRQSIYDEMLVQKDVINEALIGNEFVWKKFKTNGDDNETRSRHMQEITRMQEWLETRFNWMKSEFDQL